VAYGKIEPLIDLAERRAVAQAQRELREMIAMLDAQLAEAERQIDEKIEQIQARLRALEEGVTPKTSA